jgi:hypothetical protein
MWLKVRSLVDKLCHGEVAEWLNAAVSKTVTSVIPASGVRIPPSPRFGASQHGAFGALSARSGLRPRLSAGQLLPFQALPCRAWRTATSGSRVRRSWRGFGTTC